MLLRNWPDEQPVAADRPHWPVMLLTLASVFVVVALALGALG